MPLWVCAHEHGKQYRRAGQSPSSRPLAPPMYVHTKPGGAPLPRLSLIKMTTIDAYQAALRMRFLRLAGRRSMTALAREMRMSRNTLSTWVAGREEPSVTVRTLRKIEVWCAEQETLGQAVPRGENHTPCRT